MNKKNIPRSVKDMSKEQLSEILKKKKECNLQALKIVQYLSEETTREEWLVQNVKYINQEHYDDIVTERSISMVCGYPLCATALNNVPKQQYRISLSQKTVYDITERKKFCSNRCFKSSEHLKNQILSSPLWFRENERILAVQAAVASTPVKYINQEHYDDIVTERSISMVCGYPLCATALKNVPKQQYRISLTQKTVYDITERKKFCSNRCFKSSEHLKNQILNSPLWFRENETILVVQLLPHVCETSESMVVDETTDGYNGSDVNTCTNKINTEISNVISVQPNLQNQLMNDNDCCLKNDIRPEQSPDVPDLFPHKLENALNEWFSLKTFVYLVGEEKARTALRDQQSVLDQIMESKDLMLPYHKKFADMATLFSLLNLSENAEEKKLKPLPDYSILKTEAESLKVKVKAFYGGQTTYEASSNNVFIEEQDDAAAENWDLPLVDSQAQMALRRRVLTDRLNRTIPDICIGLKLGDSISVSDIRSLVKTFALSANNVTLKPREWDLAAVIVIKLLSLKISKLRDILISEVSKQRLTLILMSYDLPYDYLDNLVEWLLDTHRLLQKIQP